MYVLTLHGNRERTQAQLSMKTTEIKTDALTCKKLKFLHCMAASEVQCPKTAAQKQYVRTAIPPLKWQKQRPAAEPYSVPGPVWGALSPCPGYCSLSKCK